MSKEINLDNFGISLHELADTARYLIDNTEFQQEVPMKYQRKMQQVEKKLARALELYWEVSEAVGLEAPE